MCRRRVALLATAVLVGLSLVACSDESPKRTDATKGATAPSPPGSPEPSTTTPGNQQSAQEAAARVAPDLEALAAQFVAYAVGDSTSFPHWESVSMAIGGQGVKSVDDIAAVLSDRDIWKMCPGDWDGYAAASCPVDLLGPIKNMDINGSPVVYESNFSDVTCAPIRTGPLPDGRLVILRPTPKYRTCASDFALALVADEQGRLRSVDLTLSAP